MARVAAYAAVVGLALTMLGTTAWGQINFTPAPGISDADRARLRIEFAKKVTLEAWFASIQGRVAANPDYFRLGRNNFHGAAEGYLFCTAFDSAGAPDTRTLCSRIQEADRIAYYKQEMFDRALENDFGYRNGQGGPRYGMADFSEVAFLLHAYHFARLEDCAGKAAGCTGPQPDAVAAEKQINALLAKETGRPLLIEFAKRYSAVAESIHAERGQAIASGKTAENVARAAASGEAQAKAAQGEQERQAQQAQREARRKELQANPALVRSLSDAELFHGATADWALAARPPLQPDQKMYVLTGVLQRQDGDEYLVKLAQSYWAFRTTSAMRGNLVGLRVGDTVGIVGKLVAVRSYPYADRDVRPMVVLEAAYFTNDESDIRPQN